uniref:Uncharacterized protein n=1 Tax=Acrobeloides nanus TaxID=290746 RepID=A0A914CV44_9BILA
QIGPKWLSFNLAALYWRAFGVPREATLCIKAALETGQHKDIAYTQLAQVILRMGESFLEESMNFLKLALEEDKNEPIIHFLLGVEYFFNNQHGRARDFLMKSLEIDPFFEPAKEMLFAMKCSIKRTQIPTTNKFLPVCCWPNVRNAYCFKTKRQKRCFTLEERADTKKDVYFDYNRCGGVYTAKSYKPPGYAPLLIPLLYPNSERRNRGIEKQISQLIVDFESEEDLPDLPVLPLDYGGFSEERLKEFNQFEKIQNFKQFSLDYPQNDGGLVNDITNHEKMTAKAPKVEKKEKPEAEKKRRKPKQEKLPSLENVLDKKKILEYDAPLPERLPEPAQELVAKGQFYFKPPKMDSLEDYCFMYKKNPKVLEQPASTYVSVTTKGVDIEEYIDLTTTVPGISNLEPVCPEIDGDSEKTLDDLPAFKFKDQFKFYKPETALKN